MNRALLPSSPIALLALVAACEMSTTEPGHRRDETAAPSVGAAAPDDPPASGGADGVEERAAAMPRDGFLRDPDGAIVHEVDPDVLGALRAQLRASKREDLERELVRRYDPQTGRVRDEADARAADKSTGGAR